MTTMDHIRYLAETIGARGPTTPEEQEAARYAAQELQRMGLEPVTETFPSIKSTYHPLLAHIGVCLICEVLFWINGRSWAIAAFVLALSSLVSVMLELTFRTNPIRWLLPKGRSQNVWVKLPPHGQTRRQVVLLGHLDTHQAALIFSSAKWLKIFGKLIPVGIGSSLLLLVWFGIGSLSTSLVWRIISLPFVLVMLGLFLLCLQAEFSPFSAGANDNASGAGVTLSLAERLTREPLANTTVWAVLSGCEEVGDYGADAFAQAHLEELGKPYWIPVDIVGGVHADPSYLIWYSYLTTTRSDPHLLELAGRVAKANPDLKVVSHTFKGAYTEAAVGYKRGFPVLSVASFRGDGALSDWHRTTDVMANIDPDVVRRSEEFVWQLLHEIDRV